MQSAETKFYYFLPVILLIAWLWPAGMKWGQKVVRFFARVGQRQGLAIVLAGVVGFLGGAVPCLIRMPAAKVHDEFCYLLIADTFAHGRLANPTPPLWEHFETMNVIQHPTYAAKYPPGQGAILALGQILWRPILGVWLGLAFGCAAVCWMLQQWLPRGWAFIGGLLTAIHPQILAWGYNYWGGAVAMAGGALLCGGVRQILRREKSGGWFVGAGLLLLANSRPYEGFVFSLLVFVGAFWFGFRHDVGNLWPAMRRCLVPLLISAVIIAGSIAIYNQRVTGDPLRMPYMEHRKQYAIVPLFAWQKPMPPPEYRHEAIREMYAEEVDLTWGRHGLLASMEMKLLAQIQGWWWVGLSLPLFVAVPCCWRRDAWFRNAAVCLGLFLLALMTSQGVFAHYAAPAVGLLMFAAICCARQIFVWGRKRGTGRALIMWLGLVCLITVPVVWGRLLKSNAEGWFRERERVIAQLDAQPGKQLVIVRYNPGHNPNREWVYNGADLATSKILWARSMGPERDEEILSRYKDRTVWSLDADAEHPQLEALPPKASSPSPG